MTSNTTISNMFESLLKSKYKKDFEGLLTDSSSWLYNLLQIFHDDKINTCVLDFDQTLNMEHTSGRTARQEGKESGDWIGTFDNKLSSDAILLFKICHELGINLAIASFADEAMALNNDNFIAGEEMIREILIRSGKFDEEILFNIFVVGLYPKMHPEMKIKINKDWHMNMISEQFNVDEKNMILFDDTNWYNPHSCYDKQEGDYHFVHIPNYNGFVGNQLVYY